VEKTRRVSARSSFSHTLTTSGAVSIVALVVGCSSGSNHGTGSSDASTNGGASGAGASTSSGASGAGASASNSGGAGASENSGGITGSGGSLGGGAVGGTTNGGATSSNGGGSSAGAGGASNDGGIATRRPFPDTTSSISILTDQLPNLTAAQQHFVVTHFVGTEKQTLAQSEPLRALSPNFLVLHYHLSMWQSAPAVDFIIDGKTWGNDYPTVTTHEDWFLHDASNQRLASTTDGKLLMNLSNPDFAAYWTSSLESQVDAGDYDGIFFDSASPALLQAEVGAEDAPLAGTGAKDNALPELGNRTFIDAWQTWMNALDAALAKKGIPLIPNTSAFVTGWDTTNYGLTHGAFVEGFASPSFATSDWKASTNELLALAAQHKILILQNYLSAPTDVATRLYYFGNYLLVKSDRSYLEYFAAGPLEWYPEWSLALGAPTTNGATVDDLASSGIYRRDFEHGAVLVNPTGATVTVALGAGYQHVVPSGGGAVDEAGDEPGSLTMTAVTSLDVAANSAEIVVK
jgi:hypothetical protein